MLKCLYPTCNLSCLNIWNISSLRLWQPEAAFVTRNVRVTNRRTVGAEGKHLKLSVTDGRVTFDAIGFRLGHLHSDLPLNVDLLLYFESNEYNGRYNASTQS